MGYKLEFGRGAKRILEELPNDIAKKICDKLQNLVEKPICKFLQGNIYHRSRNYNNYSYYQKREIL